MKTTITSLAALVYLVPGIMASLTINTPFGVTQCQPQMISWSDGVPPYFVSIIPGGQPSSPPIKSWDPQTGNTLTWQVDIPSGTSITMAIKDGTGNTAFSDKVNVQPASPGTSCSQNADALATTAANTSPTTGTTGTNAAGSSNGSASRPIATSGGGGNTSQTNAARPASASSTPAVAVGTSNSPRPSATNVSSAASSLKASSFGLAGAAALVAAFFL